MFLVLLKAGALHLTELETTVRVWLRSVQLRIAKSKVARLTRLLSELPDGTFSCAAAVDILIALALV
jgi:hypothetical protein